MKEKIKTMQIIHLAITVSIIIAYAVVGDLKNIMDFNFSTIKGDSLYFIIIPFAAIILSNLMFKNLIKNSSNLAQDEKIGAYQTASLIRWAILEGAAFIILFIQPKLMVFGLIIIVYLLFIRPTENSINEELN